MRTMQQASEVIRERYNITSTFSEIIGVFLQERQRFLQSQQEHEHKVERRIQAREEQEEQERCAQRQLRIENVRHGCSLKPLL